VSRTVLQLRVGATRDRGFLFRTCVRPPATITIGRGPDSVLPIEDPSAPVEHPLFSIGAQGCLVDCRPEWNLTMYRDDGTVTGTQLLAEGTAMQSGRRLLMRVAPGSRGALTFGSVRLLFKWEVVPEEDIGEVPPRDVGDVPRCHACGLALRDALAREPLLARCDACRALNRFVDPDGPYRRPAPGTQERQEPGPELVPTEADSSQRVPTVSEDGDTLLAVPIFAPLTTWNIGVLPQHAQPAGRPGRDETPMEIRVAKNPVAAVEQMQTVLSKSPFVKRPPIGSSETPDDAEPAPRAPADDELPQAEELGDAEGWTQSPDVDMKTRHMRRQPELAQLQALDSVTPQEESLDEVFYTAEVEAMGLEVPDTIDPEAGDDPHVPWGTMSVLSARSEYDDGEGRIPRREVARAVHEAERPPGWFEENAALIAALAGVALLALGILVVVGGEPPPAAEPERPANVSPATAPVARAPSPRSLVPERDAIAHPTSTYVKFLPGDPTPVSVRVAGFEIDRTEVTTRSFERFLAATGARQPEAWAQDRPEQGSSRPVTGVALEEGHRFCRWAGGRLPSEPEWERAAAGTYGRMYPWGNTFQPEVVATGPRPGPVGSFPAGASESGVQDLIGNAVEWVAPADGEAPFLKGGGAGVWADRSLLMVFGRIAPDSAAWRPGPGFRCAYDI